MRSVIQREIMAVKHAMANGIPHEGVANRDLDGVLVDLLAHRAEVIANESRPSHRPAKTPARPKASAKSVSKTPPSSVSREVIPHNNGTKKQKQTTGSPQGHNSAKRPSPETTPGKAAGAGAHGQIVKKRKGSNGDFLRHLRRSIRVGDVVSVLMDVRLVEGWVRSWVRGEVIREVSTPSATHDTFMYCDPTR